MHRLRTILPAAVLFAALPTGNLRAVIPASPAITASATPYSASFVAANVFESGMAEYASAGLGAATFIEFEFPADTAVDGFLNVNRGNTADVIGNSRLIFDTNGTAGFQAATDTVVSFTPANTGSNGRGFINRFPAVTARRVRWEVQTSIGTAPNLGSMEMRFFSTATGSRAVSGVSVINAYTAFNATYVAANAANGVAGRGITAGVEYASLGGGTGTFVDFDLGAERPVTGYDFLDRIASADRITGFDLILANDPAFAAPVAVRAYANTGFSRSDTFPAPVFARYVRFDVTAVAPGVSNAGVGDMVFYEAAVSLPTDFSAAANPANGWAHGTKATPLASALEPFDQTSAADATAPCARWHDGAPEAVFAGTAPAAGGAFTGWGAGTSDWEKGALYHAWRDGTVTPVVSRWTAPAAGGFEVVAEWESHRPGGCAAAVSVVVNGVTRLSGTVNGFAGTAPGTAATSGPAPTFSAPVGIVTLAAGDTVDLVTVPASPEGNVLVRAAILRAEAAPEPTASVVIREFAADNAGELRDEDGDAADWIELYNGTGNPVDLTGWSLTDDPLQPAKWVFPSRSLGNGRRLVVFASDKDALKRPGYGPSSELHTNFKLAPAGEYLALLNATGAVVHAYSPLYPAQFPGLAYGQGANAITGYMVPTPGGPNGPATTQPLSRPVFSPASGLFTGTQSATLSGALPGQTLRYTTDGTEPTLANGTTYSGGVLSLTASATVRARVYGDGVAGPLADANYIRLGTGAAYGITPASFTSSLPLLVIDTALATSSTAKTPVPARFALFDRAPATASLNGTPALVARGAIRPRGQSSLGLVKKPYSIEFWDGADRALDLPVLGMPAESDWVLYAAYQFDTDMLRNVLAYEMYRRMGRWAPRTRFVEVFFNGGSGPEVDGNDYHGIYVLMEKVKRGKDRVDIRGMGPLDSTEPDVTGGYMVAHDKFVAGESLETQGGTLSAWTAQSGTAFIVNEPNALAITAAQRAYIWDYILKCDAAIASATFTHPSTGLHYRDYIRQDSFIDHHMLNAFAKNVDALRISTYFGKDRLGKLGMSSVWDFDRSMDSDTDNRDDNPAAWNPDNDNGISSDFFTLEGKTAEGWFNRLHQDPDYLQEWVDRFARWRTSGVLDVAAMETVLDQESAALVVPDNGGAALAGTPAARNWQRWPRSVRGVNVDGANAVAQIYGAGATSELSRHKTWIAGRIAFMDGWVHSRPSGTVAAGPVNAATPLGLTSPDAVSGGVIRYTLDGSDPRAPGGTPASGALTYTGPFTLSASARVTARVFRTGVASRHTEWSAPVELVYIVGAAAASSNNLAVTELMYHPADPGPAEVLAGFTDADSFEYLELTNLSTGRVNLAECRFSAGIDFAFRDATRPALTELGPGESLLLVKNEAAFVHRYGASRQQRIVGEFAGNDNLANGGEVITLLDRTGAVLLSFAYDDAFPWPVAADGQGYALHYVEGNPGDSAAWFAHAGTPGTRPADTDGDGQSDIFEHLAGTLPGDAASRITMVPEVGGPGVWRVSFNATAGRKYRLHGSPDLVNWTPVGGVVQPVVTGPLAVDDADGAGRRYYRLEAVR